MKKLTILFVLFLLPILVFAEESVREWKSKSGKTIIEASLDTEDVSDPETVFLLKEGKKFKIPFKNLSEEDRAYVTRVRENGRGLADDEDFGLEEVEEEADRGMKVVPTGNRYALLIGVNRYAKPIRSLRFCANDMKTLAASFQKIGVPEENIFLMTDDSEPERRPTRANIERQIESIAQLMGEEDQLTVAFSGHGVMVDGKSYLCPSDTDLENRDSIVSRDWAFEQLEKCAARQKIFIVDACRDEVAFGGTKALGGAKTLEDPIGAETHGFVLIASCDREQQPWEDETLEHGVFTHFLAEGLSGAASDEDGYVSILDLFQYASRKTKQYVFREFNRVQVPTFRQGSEMTDFILAKLETAPEPEVRTAGERMVKTVDGIEYAFRWCPPGTFTMGSPEDEPGRWDHEGPQHSVTLTKGFWILETEVTQAMWESVMGTTLEEQAQKMLHDDTEYDFGTFGKHTLRDLSGFQRDEDPAKILVGAGADRPMYYVSWTECEEFCRKLSSKLGLTVSLPTEAQWEYACRAGTTTAYSFGSSLNGREANCNGDDPYGTSMKGPYLEKTVPVKSYAPNAWGLYDMHGNVCEWCQDWYGGYFALPTSDPTGPNSGSRRVHRGGSWNDNAQYCRSANRSRDTPDFRDDSRGFRIVLAAPAASISEPVLPPGPTEESTPETTQLSESSGSFHTAGERMVKTVDGIEYAFRWCPAGSFTMGSPSSEPDRDDDETQHRVTLTRGFWMLETEVTQAMWESVMGNNPSYFKGSQNPVVYVSWGDCQEFCGKLSSKLGLTVSLPTEAQWEYACRAGTTGAYAGDLGEMGWYGDNSGLKTHPVGQKKPNAWGLYDMHGNVWEWCQDWSGSYSPSPTSDPTGPNSGSDRVLRGGSWSHYAQYCRSAYRSRSAPGDRSSNLGFRPVLASPAPEE